MADRQVNKLKTDRKVKIHRLEIDRLKIHRDR